MKDFELLIINWVSRLHTVECMQFRSYALPTTIVLYISTTAWYISEVGLSLLLLCNKFNYQFIFSVRAKAPVRNLLLIHFILLLD